MCKTMNPKCRYKHNLEVLKRDMNLHYMAICIPAVIYINSVTMFHSSKTLRHFHILLKIVTDRLIKATFKGHYTYTLKWTALKVN